MSLEQALAANTAALIAMTAALTAAGSVTTASTGTAATGETKAAAGKGKANTTKAEPKGPSVEEMQAALNEVKEKFGAAEAKSIITDVGGAKKMAEIPEAKIKAVFEAAKARLEATEETTTDENDGL